ncbi:hypothetical protein CUMW_143890 [Citrus unshiu]|uniref:Methyltransferase n=1 Tax=Citrus unshiu TaxID=55188 RepID=A0A2H5PK13_CITUN|nr:hypothetical protein CUMW_143890 [Citrus unshiu]
MERHCPPVFERKECLIPPPDGNVPYDWINKQKSNQNWLRKQGEKFLFPGGGTMFPKGVGAYVDLMRDLIPEIKDGTVRTAIDIGCGVASWGGDLLDRGILTVSLAPRDNHEAQVQFALERGIPAILGIISTQRLPFPSNSFDMAHCSRCLIPWTEFDDVGTTVVGKTHSTDILTQSDEGISGDLLDRNSYEYPMDDGSFLSTLEDTGDMI